MIQLTERQRIIRDEVKRLVRERIAPHAAEVDAKEAFPLKSYQAFKEYGLLKLALPRIFGGLEADATTLSLVIQEVAQACASSSLLIFPTQAVIRTLLETGSADQVRRFGPEFGEGDKLAAFCLSEPSFGSDAGSIQTRAEPDGDFYKVNGTKAWITLGGVADYYLVFVRTGPGKRTKGVSAMIIEKDTPGLSFGPKERKMGLHGSVTAEMALVNARVPKENLLLGEGMGWKILTEVCNNMRVWGASSMAWGLAEGALSEAVNFARTRFQFGRSLARQQSIQFMLADMKIKIEAVKSLILRTTGLIDSRSVPLKDLETLVSAAKCLASDTAMEVTEKAVQICGAEGVAKGSAVERMMRDAKAIQIFDGSNQIQRMIIAGNVLV